MVRVVGRKPENMMSQKAGKSIRRGAGDQQFRCSEVYYTMLFVLLLLYPSSLFPELLTGDSPLIKYRPATLCFIYVSPGLVVLHRSICFMCVFCIGLIHCWQIPGCGLAICFCKSSFIETQD